ncbi:MAG: GTP-binding protein [Halioglobus sp.]|nr:GTP-binding protein [Halioglobus sp.]
MSKPDSKIFGVPTTIVTGFLGVGKTSTILQLIEQRPSDERWAVLVNEFGEVGVDGSFLQGVCGHEGGVVVREVPGGCMCCAAGLPMQIALNQLLRRARPHRLLIEPTGLGHPLEVLQALSAEHYRDVLSIEKVLTVVDARKLSDSRYTDHPTFRQQIAIADVILANKEDLYQVTDRSAIEAYIVDNCAPDVPVIFSSHGGLSVDALRGETASRVDCQSHAEVGTQPILVGDLPLPDCGYVSAINSGEGFESIGWRFSPDKVFDRVSLFAFVGSLDVERMKAVFITREGVFGYNMVGDELTEVVLDESMESRIEIIATQVRESWEGELLGCIDTVC